LEAGLMMTARKTFSAAAPNSKCFRFVRREVSAEDLLAMVALIRAMNRPFSVDESMSEA
jgi:hypothetical protein